MGYASPPSLPQIQPLALEPNRLASLLPSLMELEWKRRKEEEGAPLADLTYQTKQWELAKLQEEYKKAVLANDPAAMAATAAELRAKTEETQSQTAERNFKMQEAMQLRGARGQLVANEQERQDMPGFAQQAQQFAQQEGGAPPVQPPMAQEPADQTSQQSYASDIRNYMKQRMAALEGKDRLLYKGNPDLLKGVTETVQSRALGLQGEAKSDWQMKIEHLMQTYGMDEQQATDQVLGGIENKQIISDKDGKNYYVGFDKRTNEPVTFPIDGIQAAIKPVPTNEPPKTRRIVQGLNEVEQEWDSSLNQGKGGFKNIGSGPRFKPEQGMGTEGPSGGDPLAKLSKSQQDIARAMTEGRFPYPGGFAMRSPYWQKMMEAASAIDPSFDASNWQNRVSTRREFAVGAAAKNIRSLNTLINHTGHMVDAMKELDNSSIPAWNTIANTFAEHTGNEKVQKALGKLITSMTAVKDEAGTLFKGTGSTDQQFREITKSLSHNDAIAKQLAAAKQILELALGRQQALQDQWSAAFTQPPTNEFVSPESQRILNKFGLEVRTPVREAGSMPSTTPSTGSKYKILKVVP